ncbi:MAG: flagellar biosynthetic protein FliO [Verrucomicrobiota bacterium]|nr:flagellar biosynthetic protein FliO [Verrucomicrobiota bacterium]
MFHLLADELLLDTSPAVPAPPVDYAAAMAKMCLTLLALLALMGVTFWFLRKLMQQRMQRGNANQTIRILEKRMISTKTMLYLVELEGQKILLAESHLEVRRIHGLGEPSQS